MCKRFICALLTVLLLVCAVPALADQEKEIEFSGHTFGETFSEAAKKSKISTIEFMERQKTSRVIADPVCYDARWELYQASDVAGCFFSRTFFSEKVAGHDVGTVLRFYFPTKEAAAAYDVQQAIFYCGEYEFYDENKKGTFDELKQKLASIYGSPVAEFTDPEQFWGKPTHQPGLSDEDANRIYREKLSGFDTVMGVVWQNAGSDRQIILTYSKNSPDDWGKVSLYYLDTSADALIEQMYTQEGTPVASDGSLNGL